MSPYLEKINQYNMKNGNVKSKEVNRYKRTGRAANYSNKKAQRMVMAEVDDMAWEVSQSEAGSSTLVNDEFGRVSHRSYTKSTFPDWFRNTGISSKLDFKKVVDRKKGKRFDRLKKIAIERLEKGHMSQHNYGLPDMKFKVASGKYYDNKDIIFRRIRGRIIPIKVTKRNRYDLMEEAPF